LEERRIKNPIEISSPMTDIYKLEKWLWTECDFEIMGWHDSHVYAIAFLPEKFEIVFDIDYIFQWVNPLEDEQYFSFWVSPATLIFENIYDVELQIKSYNGGLIINSIKRANADTSRNAQYIGKDKEWIWTIECQEGEIKFRSTGYKQYVRAEPKLGGQTLDLEKRETSFQRRSID
jgi:hypothetical protein